MLWKNVRQFPPILCSWSKRPTQSGTERRRRIAAAFATLLLVVTFQGAAQTPPFSRGVNVTSWFQAGSAQEIQFSKYSKTDFEQIKSLGCDVIRLPINLHGMTSGAPDHVLDPLLLSFLDHAIDWAEDLGLHLIIDNHSFNPALETSPDVEHILVPVWKQLARHLKDRSHLIYFEILNEPHGIADSTWNGIQQRVVDSIRTIDQSHTIIVGPAGWNSFHNLAAMPVYADTNLIYTFHFYDPFLFTHQGATWTDPSMGDVSGIPFPHDPVRMPSIPGSVSGTWVGDAYGSYPTEGTASKVRHMLDIAAAFAANRGVPLLCGEFGVYIPNSDTGDRVVWYETVRSYLEQKNIAWTTWDYRGGFGLFEAGSDEFFESDLNIPLVEALGFTVPAQTEPVIIPDSSDLGLYDDMFGPSTLSSSNTAGGSLDYYSQEAPHAGTYCIAWSDAGQYGSVGFDFRPNRDMSYLRGENFALSVWFRTLTYGTSLDVRFIDTKIPDGVDRPWRMRWTIDQFRIPGDGQWHRILVPLQDFTEHGSWDGAWYQPQGLFDWTLIDRFEIVAEHHDLAGRTLWIDDVAIVNTGVNRADDATGSPSHFSLGQNYPNPFNPVTRIPFSVQAPSEVILSIHDVLGRNVRVVSHGVLSAGEHLIPIKAHDLSAGTYYYTLSLAGRSETRKMMLLR